MNCKPGDLAFIVSDVSENVGRLVKVVCADTPIQYNPGRMGAFAWACDPIGGPLSGSRHDGSFGPISTCYTKIADSCLRPIRGGDISNEEDLWATKPVSEPVSNL